MCLQGGGGDFTDLRVFHSEEEEERLDTIGIDDTSNELHCKRERRQQPSIVGQHMNDRVESFWQKEKEELTFCATSWVVTVCSACVTILTRKRTSLSSRVKNKSLKASCFCSKRECKCYTMETA